MIVPGPTTFVASETCGPVNVAVRVVFAFNVTVHCVAGVPEAQALDGVQPTNCAPELGLAVRTTTEPGAKEVPVGACPIVPGPTTSVVSVTFAAKFAVAIVLAFKTMVHVGTFPIPTQMPFQFTKDEFAFGVAFTVMVVLLGRDVPLGVCVTVPGPLMTVVNENLVTVVAPVPLSVVPTSAPLGPLTVIVAARPPTTCGENVRVMEHDDPAGIGADMQVSVCEKSPGFEPPMVIDDTTSGPVACVPFCSWIVKREEEPVALSGNRIGLEPLRMGSGAGGGGVTDVADMANVRGARFVSIVSVPVKVPAAVGVKFTTAKQLPVCATGDVHVFVVERLGSPVTLMLVIVSGPYPTLLIDTLLLRVCPT